MPKNLILLSLSVLLSTGRNIISKKTAVSAGGRYFFVSQAELFFSAACTLIVYGLFSVSSISKITVLYGMIYGVLLVLSQGLFTFALKTGSVSVCSVIYSLGFIFPSFSGALLYDESLDITDFFGLLLSVAAILSGIKSDGEKTDNGKKFLLPILCAMSASGGLGIMQKLQQSSNKAEEKTAFLIIAFAFAFLISFIAFIFCRKEKSAKPYAPTYSSVNGICFAGANLCNTVLSGRMESSVFFPLQNISVLVAASILGIVLFKEKITAKTALTLLFSVAAIMCIAN